MLGENFESQGRLLEAQECYMSSVRLLNEIRIDLHCDKLKIGFRDLCDVSYTRFWRILLRQDKIVKALFAAEQGRAQALIDLMASKYDIPTGPSSFSEQEDMKDSELRDIPSNTVFQAIDNGVINVWVILQDRCVQFKQTLLDDPLAVDDTPSFIQSLTQGAYSNIGVRSGVKCENRSQMQFEIVTPSWKKNTRKALIHGSKRRTRYATCITSQLGRLRTWFEIMSY